MPGSGLGSAREAMLIRFLSKYVAENAKQRPSEVGGREVFDAVACLATAVQSGEAQGRDTVYMYRLLRIAFKELSEHFDYLDQKYGGPFDRKGGQ